MASSNLNAFWKLSQTKESILKTADEETHRHTVRVEGLRGPAPRGVTGPSAATKAMANIHNKEEIGGN